MSGFLQCGFLQCFTHSNAGGSYRGRNPGDTMPSDLANLAFKWL